MRERRCHLYGSDLARRITPARAGKTRSRRRSLPGHRDHPRSCGKDRKVCTGSPYFLGSPPLVRERRHHIVDAAPSQGITPARAGKTRLRTTLSSWPWDHPRSCGKDPMRVFRILYASGSPPLVRERLESNMAVIKQLGITPARAGKTKLGTAQSADRRDHPRSCGKDLDYFVIFASNLGSPPLVRERLLYPANQKSFVGITPARAGKTLRCRRHTLGIEDHPRSCGKDVPDAMPP